MATTYNLGKDRPTSVKVHTLSGRVIEWPINEIEGMMVDPGVSFSKVAIFEVEVEEEETEAGETPKKKSQPSIRVVELIPWAQIEYIEFSYDIKEKAIEAAIASTPIQVN